MSKSPARKRTSRPPDARHSRVRLECTTAAFRQPAQTMAGLDGDQKLSLNIRVGIREQLFYCTG